MQKNDQEKIPILLRTTKHKTVQTTTLQKKTSILLVIFLTILLGIYFQLPGFTVVMSLFEITTKTIITKDVNPKKLMTDKQIVGLGVIVPKSEILSIAAPFGAGDAKIKKIYVETGQMVKKDQLLAILDNRALLQTAVEAAKAELAVEEATLKQIRAMILWQFDEAKEELHKLRAKHKKAMQDYIRAKDLYKQEVIARSDFEEKDSLKSQYEHEINESKARLKNFLEGDIENQPDVIVARKNVENGKIQLKLKEEELKQSEIRSPIDGTIIDINVREGEKLPSEGVFYMGNLSQMRVNVEIYQTQIFRVNIGAKVKIISDALPQNLTGTVIEKGLLVEKQNRVYDSPTAQTDNRVVEVIVILDEESSKIAASFSNLQVIAKIQTDNNNNL